MNNKHEIIAVVSKSYWTTKKHPMSLGYPSVHATFVERQLKALCGSPIRVLSILGGSEHVTCKRCLKKMMRKNHD